ncbi:MAG: sigma-70 family RNA polymerase sigma factor [Planctomycetes bacterium]|nr:sigma-70 family RNA polymerase sigma factor [Planctomycetota bacterium]
MDSHTPSDSTWTAYLKDSAWVAALARRLVRDPALADDAAQDTWLAYLRHRPGHRPGHGPGHGPGDGPGGGPGPGRGSVRPWLATVLRNAVRDRLRRDARRGERERSVAVDSDTASTESAADAVLRAELQKRVFAAVLELDEPLRSTILLRYAQGRTSASIAREQGVPEGTVRWRVKEGLDRVRARFDAEHGGSRAAWVAWLAPLARPKAASFALPWIASAAAVVLVAVGFVVTRSGGTNDEPSPNPSAGEATAALVAVADPAPAAPLSPPSPAPRTATTAPDTRVTLRVVDSAGAPLEGANVRVELAANVLATAVSARDGTATVAWDLQETVFADVVIERVGCARVVHRAAMQPGSSVALGDVVLEPGIELRGVVVDPNGSPVVDAEVFAVDHATHGAFSKSIESRDPRETSVLGQNLDPFDVTPLPSTRTDAAGRFALTGLPRSGYSVFAHAPGTRFVRLGGDVSDPRQRSDARIELNAMPGAAASQTELKVSTSFVRSDGARTDSASVEFDPREPRTLRVTSARGLPLVDARVLVLDSNRRPVPCPVDVEREGDVLVFTLPTAKSPVFLSVSAPLHTNALIGPLTADEGTKAPLAAELAARALVAGVVRRDGSPVAGARVALAFEGGATSDRGFVTRANTEFSGVTRTDAQGRFALELAESAERAWLTVRHESAGVAVLSPADLAKRSQAGALDALAIELADGAMLDVGVPVAKGQSAAGFVIGVHDGLGSIACARTDDRGIAHFAHLPAGSMQVARLGREFDPYAGVGEGRRRLDARLAPQRGVMLKLGASASLALPGSATPSRVALQVSLDGAPAGGSVQRYAVASVLVDRGELVGGQISTHAPAMGEGRMMLRIVRGDDAFVIDVARSFASDERLEFELRTASLRGRVLTPRAERSRLTWVWKGPHGATCEERIRVAEDGTFALPSILAGYAELRAKDAVVATMSAAPGTEATVDVP